MTFLYRLRLLYHQFVHRVLRLLSRTYQESDDLQRKLQLEASTHTTCKAELHIAQERLAEARSQIQSLTIAASRASEDAARFRDERDSARQAALEAHQNAVVPMQKLADWQARGCPREPIFGDPGAFPRHEEKVPEGPIGAMRGRAAVRLEDAREYRVAQVDLQEIMARQRAAREAAMEPVHLPDLDETAS